MTLGRFAWTGSAAALMALSLIAWRWPVDPGAIERGFAERYDGESIERGLLFDASGAEVAAVADGVVAYRDSGESGRPGISRRGGMIVLDHDNGFRSIYSGLRGPGPAVGERVLRGRTLGVGGEEGLRLEIYDRRNGWYANPSSLLPYPEVEPLTGVGGISVVSDDGRTIVPAYNRASHPAGVAEIRVIPRPDATEPAERVISVSLTRGGETIHAVEMSMVGVEADGTRLIWVGGSRPGGELYDEEGWLRLGDVEIPAGDSISFTVRVRNVRGLERTRIFTIDGVEVE